MTIKRQLEWVFHDLPHRAQDKVVARREHRAGRASRTRAAVRWVLWGWKRLLLTVAAVAAVILIGVTWYGTTLYDRAQWSMYERQAAAYEQELAAKKVKEDAAKAWEAQLSGTPAPTSTAGKAKPAAKETKNPAPATTPAPKVVSPGATGIEKDTQDVARKFLTRWMKAADYATTSAWADAMAPYTTDEMVGLFKLTDRASVPTGKIESMRSVTVGASAQVSATIAGRGSVVLVLEQFDGVWRVVDVAPEAPAV